MSYSNPTWYGVGDPMAAQKAFQQSFEKIYNSAEQYFSEIDKEVKENEETLQKKTNQLRQELYSAKRAVPYTKQQVEALVQQFYQENKPGKTSEGGNFLKRAMTMRATGASSAELDEAIANFKGMSGNLNMFTEAALSGNYNENTLDRGNSEYLKVMNAMKAYKNDPSVLQFNYENGNFDYNFVDKDGNVMLTMDEMSASLQQLDPKVRAQINKNETDSINSIKGTVATNISEAYKKDAAAGKSGTFYSAIDYTEKEVERHLGLIRMDKSGEPGSNNFIQDQYNNNNKLGNEAKLRIFKNTSIGDGQFNGANLVSVVDKIEDPVKKNLAYASIGKLIDVPLNDAASINAEIEKLKELGVETAELDNMRDGLEEFQYNAVKEDMINKVLATGVDGQYIPKRKVTAKASSSTSTKSIVDDPYINSNGNRFRNLFSSAIDSGEEEEPSLFSGAWFFSLGGSGAKELGEKFDINYGGSKKSINATEFDPETGELALVYDLGKYKKKSGGFDIVEAAATYNIYNPGQMKKLWSDMGTEATGSNKYSRNYKTVGFNMEMLKTFVGVNGENLGMLEDPNMEQWFDWALETNEKFTTSKMKTHLQNNPNLIRTSKKWKLFNDVYNIVNN